MPLFHYSAVADKSARHVPAGRWRNQQSLLVPVVCEGARQIASGFRYFPESPVTCSRCYFNPGGELAGAPEGAMPFQGSGACAFPWAPSVHPLGPYSVVWPDVVAGVMLPPLLPLAKPGFVCIRPCGTKACPTPPLPAASAEAPNASNNPAAVTNTQRLLITSPFLAGTLFPDSRRI